MEIVSVILYPVILLLPFAFYVLAPWAWERHKFLFYLSGYLPVAILAAMRGNVGTDTENYRQAFDIFNLTDYNPLSVDPIFGVLFAVTKVIGLGFNGFAFIHASLCLLLYSFGASKIDRTLPLFGLLLLPILFIDATFNGLRYGLAFAIATVAMHYFVNSSSRFRVGYLLPPISAHSSLLVLIFLAPSVIVFALPFLLLLNVQDLLYFSYFAGKSESYSDFARPGVFSGVMPLFQFMMLLLISRINRIPFRLGVNLRTLGLLVFAAGLVTSAVSYAGLRVLQLGVFIMTIFVAQNLTTYRQRTITTLLILTGLLSVANFLRQVFLVGSEGGVVFYPYEFF
ncbi:EpsG family protein [Massilia sp. Root335]|uniref:EpsG family protein n=1 Tax=Massilia sp. Root335 TaxID=1736517 RepID=UPI0006FD632D|nr:EpsG family protein [Massilia sp. Root335]KQV41064.1 hypothetical protein ASC93_17920 [Massilia sp. Root335]